MSDPARSLFTHQTTRSHSPRIDDPSWNDLYCRHCRILMDAATARAIASDEPFMMSIYQIDRLAEQVTVKSVYVPLHFDGRRSGNFEVAYHDLQDISQSMVCLVGGAPDNGGLRDVARIAASRR